MASLYDTDGYAWSEEQSAKLRALLTERSNLDLDIENIAEEVESLGRSYRAQLVSRLMQLDEHLMKLAFALHWESRRQWKQSVKGQRLSIARLLRKNPSLRRELPQALAEAHDDAVRQFDDEKLIQLSMEPLPDLCPFELDEMLTDEWWPEGRAE